MSRPSFDVGDPVRPLELLLTPEQVRSYVRVSGMGVTGGRFVSDEDARKEGLPGQIAPGNMSLSLLTRMLREWAPEARLEKIGVTYRGFVRPGQTVRCQGFVTEREETDRGVVVETDLVLECGGERRVTGLATLLFPRG